VQEDGINTCSHCYYYNLNFSTTSQCDHGSELSVEGYNNIMRQSSASLCAHKIPDPDRTGSDLKGGSYKGGNGRTIILFK
jgi:hypothetical protein